MNPFCFFQLKINFYGIVKKKKKKEEEKVFVDFGCWVSFDLRYWKCVTVISSKCVFSWLKVEFLFCTCFMSFIKNLICKQWPKGHWL